MAVHDPEIHAHRAGPVRHGVPLHAEQTLPAFARTWAREQVCCELDVRFTSDGTPVVFHDDTLAGLTGAPGRVEDTELAGFRGLRARVLGTAHATAPARDPVPLATLTAVLDLAARRDGALNVELKNVPGERGFDPASTGATALAGVLRTAGLGPRRLTVQSFWDGDVDVLRTRLPGVECSLLVAAEDTPSAVERALACGAGAVGLAWPVDADVVAVARDRGLRVMTYTVNDAAGVRAAQAAGVDVIITDDPAMARAALAAG